MSITITLFYGSVRTDRQGIKAARCLEKLLVEQGIKVHFIDPKKIVLPLFDKMYKEYTPGTAPAIMKKLVGLISESDAFRIVTGEYNHSIPPALPY